jgi:ATP-dependent helicase HrpA
VPGLLDELVVATIRALPKPVRVQLVPAPDVAREIVARLPAWADGASGAPGSPAFREAFAAAVRAARDVVVPDDAWEDDRLPAHLRMTFRVVGERGEVIDEGKDLLALQRRLAARTEDAVRAAVRGAVHAAAGAGRPRAVDPRAGGPRAAGEVAGASQAAPAAERHPLALERTGLRAFPVDLPDGRIPEILETTSADGHRVLGYPALVDEWPAATDRSSALRGAVALRVLARPAEAAAAHPGGVRRLLLLEVGLPAGRVTSRWTGADALALAAGPDPSTAALVDDVQLAAITALTARDDLLRVRAAPAFAAVAARVRAGLEDQVHRVVAEVVRVLTASRELDAAVRGHTSLALLATLDDVRRQHAALVHPGFVASTPPDRLPHLARYLRAAAHRVAKAAEHPERDAALAWRVGSVMEAFDAARSAEAAPLEPDRRARLEDVRWLLEELRVSLFAQHLGTAVPVSEKRVMKAIAAL